ncbi:MAG TPA: hypothetical protein VG406_09875 [Isosphaeraceae bacterium]|jgi:hypothetical protein|nr:hypothetical protein [Isosphaeraceae bacterium]
MPTTTPIKAAPLIPPRPNLGPEPWAEEGNPRGWVAWSVVALVVLAAVAVIVARRRGAKRRKTSKRQMVNISNGSLPTEPRERLVAWSGRARGALVGRFGAAWGARTTEEIAADEALASLLDPGRFEGLVRLLRQADRAKFAGIGDDQGEDWEPWVAAFVAELAAGATSRINGK